MTSSASKSWGGGVVGVRGVGHERVGRRRRALAARHRIGGRGGRTSRELGPRPRRVLRAPSRVLQRCRHVALSWGGPRMGLGGCWPSPSPTHLAARLRPPEQICDAHTASGCLCCQAGALCCCKCRSCWRCTLPPSWLLSVEMTGGVANRNYYQKRDRRYKLSCLLAPPR